MWSKVSISTSKAFDGQDFLKCWNPGCHLASCSAHGCDISLSVTKCNTENKALHSSRPRMETCSFFWKKSYAHDRAVAKREASRRRSQKCSFCMKLSNSPPCGLKVRFAAMRPRARANVGARLESRPHREGTLSLSVALSPLASRFRRLVLSIVKSANAAKRILPSWIGETRSLKRGRVAQLLDLRAGTLSF